MTPAVDAGRGHTNARKRVDPEKDELVGGGTRRHATVQRACSARHT